MPADDKLTKNFKECEFCKRPLPVRYEPTLCPECLDAQLFRDVKDFIRENTVNEYEVAEHFHIPLKQVKTWIRDGRIEYRADSATGRLVKMHCQKCGAPVSFGTLCPKCMKELNKGKGYSSQTLSDPDSRMRYLDSKKEGQ